MPISVSKLRERHRRQSGIIQRLRAKIFNRDLTIRELRQKLSLLESSSHEKHSPN